RGGKMCGSYRQRRYRVVLSLASLLLPDHPLGPFVGAFLVFEGCFEGGPVHRMEPSREPGQTHLFVNLGSDNLNLPAKVGNVGQACKLVASERVIRTAKQEVNRHSPWVFWRRLQFARDKPVCLRHCTPAFQFTGTPKITTLPPVRSSLLANF